MKPVTSVIVVLVVAGVAVGVVSAGLSMASDVRRYNSIRAMSGQGPLSEDIPEMTREILKKEQGMPLEIVRVFGTLPKEAARYLKMKAM